MNQLQGTRTNEGFFCHWRRTLSLVTLVLVCLLIVGWVRSCFNTDKLMMNGTENGTDRIVSRNGILVWERLTVFGAIGETTRFQQDFSQILDGNGERQRVLKWTVPQLGLSGGAYTLKGPIASDVAYGEISYLSIIIAVMVLTALLLLLSRIQAWVSSRKLKRRN